MVRFIVVILLTLAAYTLKAQDSCKYYLKSLIQEQIDKEEESSTFKLGFKTRLKLEIHATCFVQTYPVALVKKKGKDKILAESNLDLFGQLDNTTEVYTVTLKKKKFNRNKYDYYIAEGTRGPERQFKLIWSPKK